MKKDSAPEFTRVCAYVRTSINTLNEGLIPLRKQTQAIACAVDRREQEAWELTQVVTDLGQSGVQPNRPGLRRIFRAARHPRKFDVLLVATQDRLAADWGTIQQLVARLERRGVVIYEASGRRISLQTPTDAAATAIAVISNDPKDLT